MPQSFKKDMEDLQSPSRLKKNFRDIPTRCTEKSCFLNYKTHKRFLQPNVITF